MKKDPDLCMRKLQEVLSTGSFSPGAWTNREDEILLGLLESQNPKWVTIANAINKEVHRGVKVRNGKQCKERWINHLNPSIQKGPWTDEEDLALLQYYKTYGNRWSMITSLIGSRGESNVKNRFKSLINSVKHEDYNSSIQEKVEKLVSRLDIKTCKNESDEFKDDANLPTAVNSFDIEGDLQ